TLRTWALRNPCLAHHGAQGRQHDDGLYTCVAARRAWGAQPARSALSSVKHRLCSPHPGSLPGGRGKLKLGDGEVSERPVVERLAYLSHQAQVVRHIVQGIEVQSEDLAGHEQMPQVGPGVVLTGITVTVRIKGTFISTILRVLDHHTSCRGKQK